MCVAEIGWEEAQEIYDIRAILEPAMARRFVQHADQDQVQAMRNALRRVEDTIFDENSAPNAAAVDAFFETMIVGSGNGVAQQLLKSLRARMTYLRTMTLRGNSKDQKQNTLLILHDLVDALARRDADAAEKACRATVLNSKNFAGQFFKKQALERRTLRV